MNFTYHILNNALATGEKVIINSFRKTDLIEDPEVVPKGT